MPETTHFRLVSMCRLQTIAQGKVRIITSDTSSVHARARYIENSFISVPGLSGYQFFEIGQAWNREAKKKAIVQRNTNRPIILVMMRKFRVGNKLR